MWCCTWCCTHPSPPTNTQTYGCESCAGNSSACDSCPTWQGINKSFGTCEPCHHPACTECMADSSKCTRCKADGWSVDPTNSTYVGWGEVFAVCFFCCCVLFLLFVAYVADIHASHAPPPLSPPHPLFHHPLQVHPVHHRLLPCMQQ